MKSRNNKMYLIQKDKLNSEELRKYLLQNYDHYQK